MTNPDTPNLQQPLLEPTKRLLGSALRSAGLPTTTDTTTVIAICAEIGHCLRQVPKAHRPRITAQLLNKATTFRVAEEPTVASVMLETVVSTWTNYADDGFDAVADLVQALSPLKPETQGS